MEHNQDTINHNRALRIKFRDHSWLFQESKIKKAVVERLFSQLGHGLVTVAVVERLKKSQCMDCPPGQKQWP